MNDTNDTDGTDDVVARARLAMARARQARLDLAQHAALALERAAPASSADPVAPISGAYIAVPSRRTDDEIPAATAAGSV